MLLIILVVEGIRRGYQKLEEHYVSKRLKGLVGFLHSRRVAVSHGLNLFPGIYLFICL